MRPSRPSSSNDLLRCCVVATSARVFLHVFFGSENQPVHSDTTFLGIDCTNIGPMFAPKKNIFAGRTWTIVKYQHVSNRPNELGTDCFRFVAQNSMSPMMSSFTDFRSQMSGPTSRGCVLIFDIFGWKQGIRGSTMHLWLRFEMTKIHPRVFLVKRQQFD